MNPSRKRNASLAGAFLAGASSGACSTILFQPFDVVKTRLQENAASRNTNSILKNRSGMFSTFSSLVRNEGVLSLWSGLTPSLWRCVPGVAVYFTSLETIKFMCLNDDKPNMTMGPLTALTLGATARSVTAALLMPFTVIKTRFESGRFNYKGVYDALSTIYRSEGGRGLVTGLGATLARDVPFSAVYFAVYTQLKQTMAETGSNSVLRSFCCGLVAGTVASIITQPADVIKTSLQLFPAEYNHRKTRETLRSIHRQLGFRGYFAGLLPRLVRRTLIAAMSWTVYDKVMQSFPVT